MTTSIIENSDSLWNPIFEAYKTRAIADSCLIACGTAASITCSNVVLKTIGLALAILGFIDLASKTLIARTSKNVDDYKKNARIVEIVQAAMLVLTSFMILTLRRHR